MEEASINVYNGFKRYWKRRKGYQRIDGTGRKGKNKYKRMEVAKLGDGSTGSGTKRRFWRFKMKQKLKFFKIGSPKNFFVKLRDAYVKMMLGLANSRLCTAGYGPYGGGGGGGAQIGGFGSRPMKEYDQKMIVEIYKTIMLAHQGHLVHRDCVGKLDSDDLACHR